jgi:predicted transporter
MFDISLSWVSGLGQVITYAVIIGAGLWLLSKWKVGE